MRADFRAPFFVAFFVLPLALFLAARFALRFALRFAAFFAGLRGDFRVIGRRSSSVDEVGAYEGVAGVEAGVDMVFHPDMPAGR